MLISTLTRNWSSLRTGVRLPRCSHQNPWWTAIKIMHLGCHFTFCRTRNSTGYAGCERTSWSCAAPTTMTLTVGSIRYVTVSNLHKILPPFGVEEMPFVEYLPSLRILLGTRISADLRYMTCKNISHHVLQPESRQCTWCISDISESYPYLMFISCLIPTSTSFLPISKEAFEHVLAVQCIRHYSIVFFTSASWSAIWRTMRG